MAGQIRETQQTPQTPQVIPQWSRPDDAERQARLDAMKRRATALLGIALLVFVAASLYEVQFPWLGYVSSPHAKSGSDTSWATSYRITSCRGM